MRFLPGLIISWCALTLTCAVAGELELEFTSSFDQSKQKAAAYVPDRQPPAGKKMPLLVVAHYMGGDRFTARAQGYYQECEKRQWLLVSPELHGNKTPGQFSCAALPAQHDILDSIEYMKNNYPVDEGRIFIAGRSMGGMMTALMMAKHPDLFAAGVAGQGVSNLETMVSTPDIMKNIVAECGLAAENLFEYRRRSAINYASNLQYAPLIMWHGTNDTWVPPTQSEQLFNAVAKYNRFQEPVHYLTGACHCDDNYPPAWICDRLQYYHNKAEAGLNVDTRFYPDLELVTDEAQRIFWLRLEPADKNKFARIRATIKDDGLLAVKAENLAGVAVDLDSIPKSYPIKKVELETDEDTVFRFEWSRSGDMKTEKQPDIPVEFVNNSFWSFW